MTISRIATILRWPFMRWRNVVLTLVGLLALVIIQGQINAAVNPAHPKGLATAAIERPNYTPRLPTQDTPGASTAGASTPSSSNAAGDGSGDAPRVDRKPRALDVPQPASTPQPVSTPQPSIVQGPAEQVAQAFMVAWTTTTDPLVWHQSVAALATPTYAADLASTDPERVPASQPGSMLSSVPQNDGLQVITFSTDSGPIAVEVTNTGPSWLVSGLAPVDQPPGDPGLDLSAVQGGA